MERIDDLQFEGLKIIQNDDYFCFGIDSVLLSNFVKDDLKDKKDLSIADFGCGTGVISLLLSKKTKCDKIYAFELQKEVYDIAVRNVELNKLQDRIIPENIDIKDISYNSFFDVIVTNPPYKKLGTGINSENKVKQVSRFESSATIADFVKSASKALKSKGSFYMVYRVDRLTELFSAMKEAKLEVKELQFVHARVNEQSTMVLIKAVKEGNVFLKVKNPIIIYDDK